MYNLMQDDLDDDWFPENIHEAFKELRKRKVFDVSDMYTIADAWGWTWEREVKNRSPRRWSQEWEVELATKLMLKVCFYLLSYLIPAIVLRYILGTMIWLSCEFPILALLHE